MASRNCSKTGVGQPGTSRTYPSTGVSTARFQTHDQADPPRPTLPITQVVRWIKAAKTNTRRRQSLSRGTPAPDDPPDAPRVSRKSLGAPASARRLHCAVRSPRATPPSNVAPSLSCGAVADSRCPTSEVKPCVVIRPRRTRARANLPRDSSRRGRDADIVPVVVSPPLARASFPSPLRLGPWRNPRCICNRVGSRASPGNGSARSPGRRRAIEVVCAGEDRARRPPPRRRPTPRAFASATARAASQRRMCVSVGGSTVTRAVVLEFQPKARARPFASYPWARLTTHQRGQLGRSRVEHSLHHRPIVAGESASRSARWGGVIPARRGSASRSATMAAAPVQRHEWIRPRENVEESCGVVDVVEAVRTMSNQDTAVTPRACSIR